MNLQYTKINNLLDRYLDLYNKKEVQASNISLSSISSRKDDNRASTQSSQGKSDGKQQTENKAKDGNFQPPETCMANSAVLQAPAAFDTSKMEFLAPNAKIAKANDVIEQLTKKYHLHDDDLAHIAVESIGGDDQTSEFQFQPQDYTIPCADAAKNVAGITTDEILTAKPQKRYNVPVIERCCDVMEATPEFHAQHARAEKNLQPAPEHIPYQEPKMSIMEHRALYAQIQRLKLLNQVNQQTIQDLKADNAKLKRTKKVQQKGRAKFKLLEEELEAAKARILELETRERRLQDLVSQLRRQ